MFNSVEIAVTKIPRWLPCRPYWKSDNKFLLGRTREQVISYENTMKCLRSVEVTKTLTEDDKQNQIRTAHMHIAQVS